MENLSEQDSPILLSGSRESPSGFTHIELFGDSTFKLLFTGFINDNTYKGEYFIEDGLIYFSYIDTISDYVDLLKTLQIML